MPNNNSYDGGWGKFGERSAYWEARQDGSGKTDVFPGGMPSGRHDEDNHEHIVIDSDDNIVYWRDSDGEVIIDDRTGTIL